MPKTIRGNDRQSGSRQADTLLKVENNINITQYPETVELFIITVYYIIRKITMLYAKGQ